MRLFILLLLTASLPLLPGCKEAAKAKREQDAFEELASSKDDLDRALREGMTEEGLQIDPKVLDARQASIIAAAKKLGDDETKGIALSGGAFEHGRDGQIRLKLGLDPRWPLRKRQTGDGNAKATQRRHRAVDAGRHCL